MSIQEPRKTLRRSSRTTELHNDQQGLDARPQQHGNDGHSVRGLRKRPSTSLSNNPEYRNPLQQARRRLGPEKVRRDSDDPLNPSPGQSLPPRLAPLVHRQQPAFSPLRHERRVPSRTDATSNHPDQHESKERALQKVEESIAGRTRQALQGESLSHDVPNRRATEGPQGQATSRRRAMRGRTKSLAGVTAQNGRQSPVMREDGIPNQSDAPHAAMIPTHRRRARIRRSEPVPASASIYDIEEGPGTTPGTSRGDPPPEPPADEGGVETNDLHEATVPDTAVSPGQHVDSSGRRSATEPRFLSQLRKKKLKRQATIDRESFRVKRRKRETGADDDREGAVENQEATPNDSRIYDLQSQLHEVYRAVGRVGCKIGNGEVLPQSLPRLKDKDVIAILKLCNQARVSFGELKNGNIDQDPASLLREIGERVEGLRGKNEQYPTDFADQDKSTGIYSHLIPKLVLLLRSAISCYEVLDGDHARPGELTLGRLTNTLELVNLICDLGETARVAYARPDSTHRVVSPVHNGLIVPLRHVREVLSMQKEREDLHIFRTQSQQHAAESRALQHQREERESRLEARVEQFRKKWHRLHEERRVAEGGYPSRQKLEHLRMPNSQLDIDYNGEPFYRMEVFHARIGPPPSLVDRARLLTWELDELSALESGLQEYAGPMVYEKIIRRHCGRGGLLNRFNVTELVTGAADYKEYIERQFGSDGLDDWLRGLFVWTKLQLGEGQENEGSEVV